jgi:hypothetical protein
MLTSPREPSRDGGVAMSEHPHSGGDIQPFRQGSEHFCNALGCRFEPIERGSAPGAEGTSTCLAAQRLNPLAAPVRAVADQGMNLRVGNPKVGTAAVGAGEALSGNPFRRATAAFDLAPWCHRRRDGWRWRGRVPTAGRAVVWGARLKEPLNRGCDGGGVRQGIETAMPGPNQPRQEKDEHEPAHSGRHRRPHTVQDKSYSQEAYRGRLGRSSGQDTRRAIIHYQEREHRPN